MATNTAGTDARELPFQAIHYLRKTVNFGDTGITTGIKMPNKLPAGAEIHYAIAKIKTAFNAGTTNVLTVGQNASSYNDIVSAGDVDEGTVQSNMILRGGDLTFASDTDVFVMYTQTGTAATTGKALIEIAYSVNNDA